MVEIPHFLELERDKNNNIIFEDEASGMLFNSTSTNTVYGSGFLNDVIGWISGHAGFTYSAHIASGRCANDTKRLYDPSYSNEYRYAQQDVFANLDCGDKTDGGFDRGRSDAYLGT